MNHTKRDAENFSDPMAMTLGEALAMTQRANAGLFKLSGEDEKGEPVFALVVVMGRNSKALLDAVEAIERTDPPKSKLKADVKRRPTAESKRGAP